jgi:hypothetical protein
LARDRRWHTVLAVAPNNALASAFWPEDVDRLPQGSGDIGQRMARQKNVAALRVALAARLPDFDQTKR